MEELASASARLNAAAHTVMDFTCNTLSPDFPPI
jgi:hypothetical protein